MSVAARVAQITAADGFVTVIDRAGLPRRGKPGTALFVGETVENRSESALSLHYFDGARIDLAPAERHVLRSVVAVTSTPRAEAVAVTTDVAPLNLAEAIAVTADVTADVTPLPLALTTSVAEPALAATTAPPTTVAEFTLNTIDLWSPTVEIDSSAPPAEAEESVSDHVQSLPPTAVDTTLPPLPSDAGTRPLSPTIISDHVWPNHRDAPYTLIGVAAGDTGVNSTTGINEAIDGQYGQLTLAASGDYRYQLYVDNPASPAHENRVDRFTYTVQNQAGAIARTTLAITLIAEPLALDTATPALTASDEVGSTAAELLGLIATAEAADLKAASLTEAETANVSPITEIDLVLDDTATSAEPLPVADLASDFTDTNSPTADDLVATPIEQPTTSTDLEPRPETTPEPSLDFPTEIDVTTNREATRETHAAETVSNTATDADDPLDLSLPFGQVELPPDPETDDKAFTASSVLTSVNDIDISAIDLSLPLLSSDFALSPHSDDGADQSATNPVAAVASYSDELPLIDLSQPLVVHELMASNTGPQTSRALSEIAIYGTIWETPPTDLSRIIGVAVGDCSDAPMSGIDQMIEGEHGVLLLSANGSYRFQLYSDSSVLTEQRPAMERFTYTVDNGDGERAHTVFDITLLASTNDAPSHEAPSPERSDPTMELIDFEADSHLGIRLN